MEWMPSRRQRWFDAPCHLCRLDTVDPDGLCPDCRREWRAALGRPRCRGCGLILAGDGADGKTCAACVGKPSAFEGVIAAVDLDPSVRALVHRLKYRQDFSVVPLLQATLVEAARADGAVGDIDVLVPMPLHPRQRRRRGFNQSWLLADGVARATGLPLLRRGVRRVRDTGSLTALSARERRRTLKGAFAVDGAVPRRVAIIDDVLTTGASARALAAALRQAGAASVSVWALARTP
ncbi:double zinc ribbon domain-containing protein [Guyparkeria hydrothermalis]|uniref:ComF family protein n=1 Tax=Guyparkeria hydrothermalis TaxID=923 RepID=UPI002021B45A|nr:double zinc ribbon domain-containing protein [Guyparkeria hydrothermalis]MCL7751176.1 double zinc ribbon domain-containing protein [Guyparkeria hydrothermalis]